jgi:probable phosphoglycerate mutase
VSVVRYTNTRPYVLRSNDVGADLSPFVPPKKRARRRKSDDAAVGGGAGSGAG